MPSEAPGPKQTDPDHPGDDHDEHAGAAATMREEPGAPAARRTAAVPLVDGGAHVNLRTVTLDSRLFALRKAPVLWFDIPTPSPVPTSGVDADLVTPGVWGFAITFLLVIVVVLLIIDMMRRIRRVTLPCAGA